MVHCVAAIASDGILFQAHVEHPIGLFDRTKQNVNMQIHLSLFHVLFASLHGYCSCLLFMLFSWSIRFSKCETARLLPTLFQQFEFLTPTSGKSGRWHARLHFKMSIYFQNTTVCKIEKSILSFTGIHKYANPAVVACTSHPTFLMSRKASHRETRMAWTSFLKVSGPQFWQ